MQTPNKNQLEVINDLENNIILFASAGTGKTFTVAQRMKHAIESGKANPEEILCLTFTVKACNEMRTDLLEHIGQQAKEINIQTIHSFCLSLLREEAKLANDNYIEINVCDEVDVADKLRLIIEEKYGVEYTQGLLRYKPESLSSAVSKIKHQRHTENCYSGDEAVDYQNAIGTVNSADLKKTFSYYCNYDWHFDSDLYNIFVSNGGELIKQYNEELRQTDYMDFDDLIIQANILLQNSAVLDRWQNRFKFITVDEMQDTSQLEYDTISAIFLKANVMMCGDYFQTIYQWRGSNPNKILNEYINQFSAQKRFFSINYRSTQILSNATFGYLKNTYPELMGEYCPNTLTIHSPEIGDKILVQSLYDPSEEARWIYDYLLKNRPDDPTKVCVLARSNGYIQSLYTSLTNYSTKWEKNQRLRFFTVAENQSFYRTPAVKDLLAALRILLNDTDNLSMERIARRYIDRVGDKTLEKIRNHNNIGVTASAYLRNDTYEHGDPYFTLLKACDDNNIVVFDTETTGLDLTKDQVIQIAAIKYNSQGETIDTFEKILVPTVEICQDAKNIIPFNVGEEIKAKGIPSAQAYKEFSEFVSGCLLVGHNSKNFDIPLVSRQMKDLGLPELNILGDYDTLTISKEFLPTLKNYKLATLCEHYGITNKDAHNAMGDVDATGAVLFELIQEIRKTATERFTLLTKYLPKFKGFYNVRKVLLDYMKKGNIQELFEAIIVNFNLIERYSQTKTSKNALLDIWYMTKNLTEENPQQFIREFVTNATLSGSQTTYMVQKLNQIPILTVHQSKGCEYDTVILAGAHDFPSYVAQQNGDISEEPRVFYVAISRAKKKLVITYPRSYKGHTKSPSPYIDKIPSEYKK